MKIIKQRIKKIKVLVFKLIDLLLSPLTVFYSYYFKIIRIRRFNGMPFSQKIMFNVGVLPIIDHYYEPLINHKKHLRKPLKEKRNLPGINFNVVEQLELIKRFNFKHELLQLPLNKITDNIEFCYLEGPFPPADAEFYYNMIRLFKPEQIIEIGCGHSTLVALKAIQQNKYLDIQFDCQLTCIEPYENNWLEKLNVNVIRKKVEDCDISLFKQLKENDILFIDSTHVIRPQGDVLFEYLEILPSLQPGVLIHIHDIFTPEHYPEEWVFYGNRLWNEQYLLEAFLTFNNEFTIIGSTNYLLNNHYEEFGHSHPVSKLLTERHESVGAGSFWMKKN